MKLSERVEAMVAGHIAAAFAVPVDDCQLVDVATRITDSVMGLTSLVEFRALGSGRIEATTPTGPAFSRRHEAIRARVLGDMQGAFES